MISNEPWVDVELRIRERHFGYNTNPFVVAMKEIIGPSWDVLVVRTYTGHPRVKRVLLKKCGWPDENLSLDSETLDFIERPSGQKTLRFKAPAHTLAAPKVHEFEDLANILAKLKTKYGVSISVNLHMGEPK